MPKPADTSAVPSAPSSSKRGAYTPSAQYGLHRHGYILGKTLGSGAYAKVKVATSLKMNKEVAIKIISKKTAPKDVVEKFIPREIEVLKEISHENVVKLYDVVTTDDAVYLVMELAESGDLLDFINSRRYLSERIARTLFNDMLKGIEKCHSMKIVHRDLKCENLLLDSRLVLKISDFGFARKQPEGDHLETYCGSYAYAAPEVILGQPYIGESADIWSMGVVLYAMLAGKLPFKDSDVRTLLHEISTCLTFPKRLTEECKSLILRMLTFSPHERATIKEIREHPWMRYPVAPDGVPRESFKKKLFGGSKPQEKSPQKKSGGSAADKSKPVPSKG